MSWNSIFVDCGDVRIRNYGNSTRFFILEGIFAGYAFWHPAKLVKEPCGGLYEIVYKDNWSFVLKKTEIVDGFHRYTTMLKHKDIYERGKGPFARCGN